VIVASSSELRVGRDEATLVDWLRHYGALITLFLVVGMAFGSIYAALGSDTESTTLIVDREGVVPAREFGVVGEAVFRSDAALRPAMQELGISTSTERFLSENVKLRPVPDARILIVVGRASTATRAREISSTMADALVAALTDAGVEGLAVLRGGAAGHSLAPRVAAALGGFSALWLGIGAAIALFHVHRPVLSLATAMRLVDVSRVTQLEGRASWLGALRLRPRLRRCTRNDFALGRLASAERSVLIETPGSNSRRSRRFTRTLLDELRSRGVAAKAFHEAPSRGDAAQARDTWMPDGGRTTLLVTDPRTDSRELSLEALGWWSEEVHLIWIR
jgi:hypothetical protein